MDFKVVLTLSKDAQNKSALINNLFSDINNFVVDGKYGEGIYEYLVSLYVINPPIGYEHLHKDFIPKYTEYKLVNNKFIGKKLEIKKQFHYSIKIDGKAYSNFLKASEEENKKLLAKEILKSLSNLDKLPKKVKDFDKERFKSDMEQFFKSENLI